MNDRISRTRVYDREFNMFVCVFRLYDKRWLEKKMRHIILFLFETILHLFVVATDSTRVDDNMCLVLYVELMTYIITVKTKEEQRKE